MERRLFLSFKDIFDVLTRQFLAGEALR